jgi:hypothetical protein
VETVLFTDEARFPLTQCDGRQHVWRYCGEQYMPNVVQEGDRFGQGFVMVLGGISIDSRTDLTAAGYISRYCYSMCWLLHMVLVLNLYSCTTMPGLM